jgi:hypothetical protein
MHGRAMRHSVNGPKNSAVERPPPPSSHSRVCQKAILVFFCVLFLFSSQSGRENKAEQARGLSGSGPPIQSERKLWFLPQSYVDQDPDNPIGPNIDVDMYAVGIRSWNSAGSGMLLSVEFRVIRSMHDL